MSILCDIKKGVVEIKKSHLVKKHASLPNNLSQIYIIFSSSSTHDHSFELWVRFSFYIFFFPLSHNVHHVFVLNKTSNTKNLSFFYNKKAEV
jgi:hypothetical protein